MLWRNERRQCRTVFFVMLHKFFYFSRNEGLQFFKRNIFENYVKTNLKTNSTSIHLHKYTRSGTKEIVWILMYLHCDILHEPFILKVEHVHFFFFFFNYKLFKNKKNILSFIYIYHYLNFFKNGLVPLSK